MNLVDIADRAWRALPPCGVLVSYFAVRNGDVAAITEPWRERGVPVFCDSGAFGALSAKTTIDVNDYKAWLLDHRELFDVIANLDVIGSVEGSEANERVLVEAGLPVLPVFHVGEPWEVLDRMAAEHGALALGRHGVVPSWRQRRRMDQRRVPRHRRACALVHGFGVTRWQFLRDFPWSTVDSTTWLSGARYGAQLVWNGARLIQLDRKGLAQIPQALRQYHDVSVDQALRGASGDHAIGYRIALRAMAIAQQNRRVHQPGFTIYCSGVI